MCRFLRGASYVEGRDEAAPSEEPNVVLLSVVRRPWHIHAVTRDLRGRCSSPAGFRRIGSRGYGQTSGVARDIAHRTEAYRAAAVDRRKTSRTSGLVGTTQPPGHRALPEASGPTTSDLPVLRSRLNLAVYPRHLDHPRVSQPIASHPRQRWTRSSWPTLPATKRECWLAAERSMYLRRRVHVSPLVSFKIPAQWRSIPVKAAIHLQSLGKCADDRASLGARRKTCSWPISPMTAAPHSLDVRPT